MAELGQSEQYRIDKVRSKAGLIRKVFDKTILDMDRIGTIELLGGSTDSLNPSEIENLIRDGEKLYVHFKFLDSEGKSPGSKTEKVKLEETVIQAPESEDVEIVLLEVNPSEWQRFKHRCLTVENKDPLEKLLEMIRDYL